MRFRKLKIFFPASFNRLCYGAVPLQWNMEQLSKICLKLITIIVLSLSKSSQRYFYRICHLSPCGGLLERSHFNRRSEQLIGLVQIIWQALNAQMSPDKIVIMDRFPFPHCQPVRNYRTRIFEDQEGIGYNFAIL